MKEILTDVLSQDGEKTGEVKPLDSCHRLGYWHLTAHIWVINQDGHILLQKRGPNDWDHPGKWQLSSISHVHSDEDASEACLRSLKDEYGLDLKRSNLIFLFSIKRQALHENNSYINNEFNDVFIVHKEGDSDHLEINNEKIKEVKWVSLSEFENWFRDGRKDFVIYNDEYEKIIDYLRSRI